MKDYIKGVATGLIIAIAIAVIPVFAKGIDVVLNNVRISVDGMDKAQWGESYTLDNGADVPYSILYEGTTYLPLRKIGDINGKDIYWNGDTRTASMTESKGEGRAEKVIAERADSNGNVWTYYTFYTQDEKCYLGVKDKARNFERIYLLSGDSVYCDENAIYFAKKDREIYGGNLYKIDFANNENTQDGIMISELTGGDVPTGTLSSAKFATAPNGKTYLIYVAATRSNVSIPILYALDIASGAQCSYKLGPPMGQIEIDDIDNKAMIVYFTEKDSMHSVLGKYSMQIIINGEEISFGEKAKQ
jgi:hypothetical protein